MGAIDVWIHVVTSYTCRIHLLRTRKGGVRTAGSLGSMGVSIGSRSVQVRAVGI